MKWITNRNIGRVVGFMLLLTGGLQVAFLARASGWIMVVTGAALLVLTFIVTRKPPNDAQRS